MEKLYGYKEKDVVGLLEYIKDKKGSLKNLFVGYSQKSNKSVGTVRNLYYAIVKLSNEDSAFCEKYLNGKPLTSNQIVTFSESEEKEIIKKILLYKAEGYSVRKAIFLITNGDQKLALRYQNKYRSAIKDKKEFVKSIILEIKKENPNFNENVIKNKNVNYFDDKINIEKLKKEINDLYEKLFLSLKKENQRLIEENKILALKSNINLDSSQKISAIEYFKKPNSKNMRG